jgi:hypothetical protein
MNLDGFYKHSRLVLQMWRVQVMVIDHMQSREAGLLRRIAELERELGDTYAGKRTDVGGSDADWRPDSHSRRRDADSND